MEYPLILHNPVNTDKKPLPFGARAAFGYEWVWRLFQIIF
ncbi:hypothetical protein DET0550 [Dehalococcoides mccartyi 195]|uniref:Uncharacterized protein n=1 Tax=Dehalococcoides mccartyi (strain ATCC BAA-2266 / KCTC 15142 / 195) TaxID=243164 RepID=Q3Z905_DEHM1|nr:hypothetical protein DET0550 [Dehalococcoides mccartyi 195]